MGKLNMDMCHGPVFMKMARFAMPVFITGFLQQFFNAVDVILAGRLTQSGSDAVAAVGSTSVLTNLLINFFIGCSVGASVKLSHNLGSHDDKAASRTVHTSMLLSIVIGLFITVFGFIFTNLMLGIISTPDYLKGLASLYLKTYFFGMVPYMVYNFGAALLRATGETKKPLYYLLLSGPFKIALTFLFTLVIPLDVAGLALATTLSQTLAAVLVVIELMKRSDGCKLCFSKLRFHSKELAAILRLGIPSGVQSATFSLSSVILQKHINSFAHIDGFLAGDAAATSLVHFANTITAAFYHSSITFVGQNTGAGNYKRVKEIYYKSLALTLIGTGLFSLIVCLLSRQLIGIYIHDSQASVEWGHIKLMFLYIPLVLQGVMDVATGSLRGMGISISSMIISLVGVCGVRIGWIYTVFLIPSLHTPQTLYHSFWISWLITFLAQDILFRYVYKRRTKCTR